MDLSARDLMLLTHRSAPFSGPYHFELKYDGWRLLALRGESVRLLTRHGTDLTQAFPEVVAAISVLPPGTALDGEIVVLDRSGRPVFEALQSRAWRRSPNSVGVGARSLPATLAAFDMLYVGGQDLRKLAIEVRKSRLEQYVRPSPNLLPVLPIEDKGKWLFEKAEALGLEGIVAKRKGSTYRRGRTADWLKIKTEAGREAERRRLIHRR